MPRTKSAVKQRRQSLARARRNRAQRSQLRTILKRARAAIGEKAADTEKVLAEAIRLLDRAGRKNLVHRNATARTKSRLAKLAKKG